LPLAIAVLPQGVIAPPDEAALMPLRYGTTAREVCSAGAAGAAV